MMPVGNRIVIMGAGFIPIMAGIGFRIIRGAQQLFIMGVGFTTRVGAGVGGRKQLGHRLGFAGAIQMIIAAGRRCRRIPFIKLASALFTMARR